MSEEIKYDRRRFLAIAAMSVAAAEFGMTGAADAQSSKPNPLATSVSKPAKNISFGALKQIDAGVLNVGYADVGPTDRPAGHSSARLALRHLQLWRMRRCWSKRATG